MQEFVRLKEQALSLRRRADQGDGALTMVKKQLMDEFGCDNMEAAEKLLKRLEREREAAEREYQEELDRFIKEWGETLT